MTSYRNKWLNQILKNVLALYTLYLIFHFRYYHFYILNIIIFLCLFLHYLGQCLTREWYWGVDLLVYFLIHKSPYYTEKEILMYFLVNRIIETIKRCWDQDSQVSCPLSYTCFNNNSNMISIHGQKCLDGVCGTQHHRLEQCHPPLFWELGIQTSVPAVEWIWGDLWMGCSPSGLWSRTSENTALDNHSWMRKPMWKSRSPKEQFQHTVREKNNNNPILDSLERAEGTVSLYPQLPLPQVSTAQCQGSPSWLPTMPISFSPI